MNKQILKWRLVNRIAPNVLRDIPNRALYLSEMLYRNRIYPQRMAEIGVWRGHSSIGFLRLLPTLKTFYAIDPWETYEEYLESKDAKAKKATWEIDEAIFRDKIYFFRDKVTILKSLSTLAAKQIDDASLDFVFIDGNHSYEYVRDDIISYLPKVKTGGIIAGHDMDHSNFPGVRKAVEEIIGKQFHIGKDKVWWIIKK